MKSCYPFYNPYFTRHILGPKLLDSSARPTQSIMALLCLAALLFSVMNLEQKLVPLDTGILSDENDRLRSLNSKGLTICVSDL